MITLMIISRLVGLLAIAVGIVGFCIDTDHIEGELSTTKLVAIMFFLLAIELIIHQIFIECTTIHYIIHIMLVLTASAAGIYGLSVLRDYSTSFSRGKFKDILIYGSVIWLIDKHISLAEFRLTIYYVLIAVSMLVAILSFYVILKITRLKAFFTVGSEPILCAYFVIFLIGESTLCMCVLPLLISAIVEFYLFYMTLRIAEPLLR